MNKSKGYLNLSPDDVKIKKPRGRMSAYSYFCQQERANFKAENPDNATFEFGEFMRLCAEKWKTIPEEIKEPFNRLSASDKKRYDVEMAHYKKLLTKQQLKTSEYDHLFDYDDDDGDNSDADDTKNDEDNYDDDEDTRSLNGDDSPIKLNDMKTNVMKMQDQIQSISALYESKFAALTIKFESLIMKYEISSAKYEAKYMSLLAKYESLCARIKY